MNGLRQAGDHRFFAGFALHVDVEEDRSLPLEARSEFHGDARLAHPPLARQQHVVAVLNSGSQLAQFDLSVEEVLADDRWTCGRSHSWLSPGLESRGSEFPVKLGKMVFNSFVVNKYVVIRERVRILNRRGRGREGSEVCRGRKPAYFPATGGRP